MNHNYFFISKEKSKRFKSFSYILELNDCSEFPEEQYVLKVLRKGFQFNSFSIETKRVWLIEIIKMDKLSFHRIYENQIGKIKKIIN